MPCAYPRGSGSGQRRAAPRTPLSGPHLLFTMLVASRGFETPE